MRPSSTVIGWSLDGHVGGGEATVEEVVVVAASVEVVVVGAGAGGMVAIGGGLGAGAHCGAHWPSNTIGTVANAS